MSQLGISDDSTFPLFVVFVVFVAVLDRVFVVPMEPVAPVLSAPHLPAEVGGAALLPQNPELGKLSNNPQAMTIEQTRFMAHLRVVDANGKDSSGEEW